MATICPFKPHRRCCDCIHYRLEAQRYPAIEEPKHACFLAEDRENETAYDDMILNDKDAQLLFGR